MAEAHFNLQSRLCVVDLKTNVREIAFLVWGNKDDDSDTVCLGAQYAKQPPPQYEHRIFPCGIVATTARIRASTRAYPENNTVPGSRRIPLEDSVSGIDGRV